MGFVLVLLVEVGEVDDEVLDDVEVRERRNHGRLRKIGVDGLEAGQIIQSIDVHRA